MLKINSNYKQLKDSYLFYETAHRLADYQKEHPDKNVIKMGIGDVTRPLCPAVVDALKKASEEMGVAETFRGYGPEQGYDFLREKVRDYYAEREVELELSEIFISDGAKSDCGNILDIFSKDNLVLVPDPVYPVYVDTNVMAGRRIIYMDANESNDFLPGPGEFEPGTSAEDAAEGPDLIYICSPNNPTGAAYDREQLKEWVDYANEKGAVILFDAAYESFAEGDDIPRSIFEIPGARTCAIELCSLSKTAGFTGTRCGYTVVPHDLVRDDTELNALWLRRQTTKFNGVSYVVQRGAEAVFTPEGRMQIKENIDYYKENARVIMDALEDLGIWYTGGVHSPYIWFKCPEGMDSWTFFDFLLKEAGVVGTPGQGFGNNGEGFFRLTAFSTRENTEEAMERLKKVLAK
ncbi:MAG: LL-diaminopimelate aminotransferase [Eubacteriales bacterium]|nr:LL-diaminopimelate aminotransferase [Eubacteriales bacterium]